MYQRSVFLFAALLVAMLLFSASYGNPPQSGGSVVVTTNTEPGGLNPSVTTQHAVHLVCGSIFSGLVAHDFDLNPVPDLAERWTVSPDGRIYTFYLNQNAAFHDGAPVTSEDVKFTFEELLLKYHPRARVSIGDKLRQISAPDRHTIVFEFNRPYAAFLQLIDVTNAPVMPKHLYKNTDPLTNPRNANPIGSGAFKFQDWAKGDRITLVKNESYFKPGKPYLESVVYKVMPSSATAAIAFENGETDYFLNPSPLDVERLNRLPNVTVTDKGREGYATVETIVFNLNREPLSDARVRQAMARAIDRNYIVEKIAFGKGLVAAGPVSSLLRWAHNPNLPKYERDVALANQMLDEAGYKRDAESVRFRLKAVYAQSYGKIFDALADQLREVGIRLESQQMEFNAAVEQVYIKKDFDLGFTSFENGADPDIGVKRTVVSSNIGAIPFSNGAGYRNSRIDELFELAASETNKEKRAAYYFEAQEILVKDLPYLWLYEPLSSSAYKSGLQGMYQWSAKSNVYFAQDAWWIDGERGRQTASEEYGTRRFYFFLIITGVILLIAAIMIGKKLRA